MKLLDFIIFVVFTAIIHDLCVKWEIRQNIELFKDLEVPKRWKKNKIKLLKIRFSIKDTRFRILPKIISTGGNSINKLYVISWLSFRIYILDMRSKNGKNKK